MKADGLPKKVKTVKSILGICAKAGRLSSGEDTCIRDIQSGKAYAILLANDVSENTDKLFTNKCEYYGVPLIKVKENKEELGAIIGKSDRSAVSVLDSGFAKAIMDIQGEQGGIR